ncbi:uncharacterized protein LOC141634121 isoform X2 [Silene latifolia]|uniref:uncharacterized protein LOC141634121 isoform X2 n=1 Tax=Silene latifolia TaxID=37657 RepID=UPI003D77ED12
MISSSIIQSSPTSLNQTPRSVTQSSVISTASLPSTTVMMPPPFSWTPTSPVTRQLFTAPVGIQNPSAPSSSTRFGGPTLAGSIGLVLPPLSGSIGSSRTATPPGFNPLRPSLSTIANTLVYSTPNVKNIVTTELSVVEDYLPWRTQFESFLVSHGLLGMIDGSIPIPSTYTFDVNHNQVINPEYSYWLKLDQTVRSWIFATLSRDTLVEVHDVRFSASIWERLQVRFMSASMARSMELKRLLSNMSKDENQSMEHYLREIKLIVDSLAAINSPVSNQDLLQYVVQGLGSDYETLVTVITQFPGSITFDDLRARLLVQEQRVKFLKNQDNGVTSHQAFATATTNNGSSSTPSQKQAAPNTSNKTNNNNNSGWRNNNNNRGGGRWNKGRWNNNNNRGRGQSGQQGGTKQNTSALPAQNNASGNSNSSVEGVLGSAPPPVVCQICYHTGHTGASCPSRYTQTSAPAMVLPSGENNDAVWYPDSGAASHMTNNEGSNYGS